jgi:ABC-2 type transport system ATP-binding protein
VVLLDEPTAGLDPASARHVRDLILRLRDEGRAVLVSTHNLAEAEEVATRIAVLRTRLLALDTPAALRRGAGMPRVDIDVEGDAAAWRTVVSGFSRTFDVAGPRLSVTLDPADRVPDLVAALAGAGARIVRVTPGARSLEQVYLDLVKEA